GRSDDDASVMLDGPRRGEYRQRRGRGRRSGLDRCASRSGPSAWTQDRQDSEHQRSGQEQREYGSGDDAGRVGAAGNRKHQPQEHGREQDPGQQPRKAAPPPAVKEEPERARPLFRFAHSSEGSSASVLIVGTPSRGSSSAWAVTMTARMPSATGPS